MNIVIINRMIINHVGIECAFIHIPFNGNRSINAKSHKIEPLQPIYTVSRAYNCHTTILIANIYAIIITKCKI